MKEFFKTNWKIILICILGLFAVSKCTQSCTRGSEIKELNSTISAQDSIIMNRDSMINMMSISNKNMQDIIDIERKHSENFTDIAIGNQNTVREKMDKLSIENHKLKIEIENLIHENDSLKAIDKNI